MNGKYVVRETEIENRVGNKLYPARKIIIGFHDPEYDLVYPSPLTDFIHKYYYQYSLSLSIQRQPAVTVTQFLNYLSEMTLDTLNFNSLYSKGVYGLTLEHGNMFLNHSIETEGWVESTLSRKISHLTSFYHYLNENGLLEIDISIKNTKNKFNRKGRNSLISPFKDVQYPLADNEMKKKKKDFITTANKDRIQMVREFILTSLLIDPGITLGIAFLFFAGLRIGEVVNLKKSSIIPQNGGVYGEKGMVLEVRENISELFSHLQSTKDVRVKKPRDQVVLIDPLIPWLYEKHLRFLDISSKKKVINDKALFFGSRNGKALSGSGFYRRFNNIKQVYLNTLAKTPGRLQDYLDFAETRWSSHIGRGTFTNLLVESGFNPEQTAIARGDSDISSALDYTDEMTALHNISIAIETLSKKRFDENLIDIPDLGKTWKEVIHFGKI